MNVKRIEYNYCYYKMDNALGLTYPGQWCHRDFLLYFPRINSLRSIDLKFIRGEWRKINPLHKDTRILMTFLNIIAQIPHDPIQDPTRDPTRNPTWNPNSRFSLFRWLYRIMREGKRKINVAMLRCYNLNSIDTNARASIASRNLKKTWFSFSDISIFYSILLLILR